MEVKNYFATDTQGNVLGSAQVYLYLAGTTTLATGLQNISGAALGNPFTSDANGLVQFKAPDNDYDLRVVKPGREFTIRIQCFDGVAFLSGVTELPAPNSIPKSNSGGKLDKAWLDGSFAEYTFSHAEEYPEGTLSEHASNQVIVTDKPFSAKPGTQSTESFQMAYDYVSPGGVIVIPAPGPYLVGDLTGSKQVTWHVEYDISSNLELLSLPGRVVGGLGSSLLIRRSKNNGSEFATIRSDRIADYNGGSAGSVCSNIRATTTVSSSGANSFEWVGLFRLDNSGPGQNVGIYGQGNRRATSSNTPGGTFAGCLESRDFTQEANPTSGLIGLEIDSFANGTDSVGRRIALDIVSGKGVDSGAASESYCAVRIGPQNGDSSASRFRNGILISGSKDYAFNIQGETKETSINIESTGGNLGINIGGSLRESQISLSGSAPYGIRFSGTYSTGIAIRLNAGMAIGLEGTGAIKLQYTTGKVQIMNTTVEKTSFNTITGAVSVTGKQVIGPRSTGWTPMTGSSDKGTSYDTSTITLPQLAARLNALQKALTDEHGLIGLS